MIGHRIPGYVSGKPATPVNGDEEEQVRHGPPTERCVGPWERRHPRKRTSVGVKVSTAGCIQHNDAFRHNSSDAVHLRSDL